MSVFFSFDGIDGGGKSTQMDLLVEWLRTRVGEVETCRDPGGTPLGERVREILLQSGAETPIAARSEMLLYMASRAQLVDQVIGPALAAGRIVVSDRFLLANVVYQGYAGGLPVEQVREVGAIATTGVSPDCTFLLDMDPATALERLGRPLDRVESRGDLYRQLLRDGFLAEAQAMGESVHRIDAARPAAEVQAEIREIAQRVLDARVG